MGVDLRNNSMFARTSLVLLDDCLVKLEHGRTQDRMRRFMFDAIESVIIWRRIPWLHVFLCVFFLVLPGIGILFIGETFATVSGVLLIVLGGGLILWYLIIRRTTLRIVRAGKTDDVVGMFWPGRLRRVRERLVLGIQRAQEASAARASAQSGNPDAVLPPPPLPAETESPDSATPTDTSP